MLQPSIKEGLPKFQCVPVDSLWANRSVGTTTKSVSVYKYANSSKQIGQLFVVNVVVQRLTPGPGSQLSASWNRCDSQYFGRGRYCNMVGRACYRTSEGRQYISRLIEYAKTIWRQRATRRSYEHLAYT